MEGAQTVNLKEVEKERAVEKAQRVIVARTIYLKTSDSPVYVPLPKVWINNFRWTLRKISTGQVQLNLDIYPVVILLEENGNLYYRYGFIVVDRFQQWTAVKSEDEIRFKDEIIRIKLLDKIL